MRITVDERLDPDFIRLAVADLEDDSGDLIDDELDSWSEERAEFVHSKDFREAFGVEARAELLSTLALELASDLRGSDPAAVFWNCLEEGQVYLVGEFEIRGARADPDAIVPRAGAFQVLRIDRIPKIKRAHKARYSQALPEGS